MRLSTFLLSLLPGVSSLLLNLQARKKARQQQAQSAVTTQDSPCSTAHQDEATCLGVTDASCMFIALESKNLCLPCELASIPLPCPPTHSFYAGSKVQSCTMKCSHQQVLSKSSPCTDVTSGKITQSQCFAKGEASGEKCMHTSFKTADGVDKSICGPCSVPNVGKIACYAAGNAGPEDGSTVSSCSSACDLTYSEYGIPCGGATPCPPSPPPPATIEAFKLGEGPTDSADQEYGVKLDEGAPDYFAAKVPAPYDEAAFRAAAKVAAKAAGWWSDAALPPKAAVVVWGKTPAGGAEIPGSIKQMWGPGPSGVDGGVADPGVEDGVLPRVVPEF